MALPRGLLLAAALSLLLLAATEAGTVGVNWGRVANDLPSPASVVQLLKQHGIGQVKLYDTEPTVLRALANSGIKVVVALPNEQVAAAAKRPSYALAWVRRNVAAYYPATQIQGVAVGNEVFATAANVTSQLVAAMTNVHAALARLNMDKCRQGVVPHRAHGAGGQLPAVGGGVQGGAVAVRDEAHAGLSGADGVVPHGERVPVLRLRGQRGRHLPRLRALPPQRRGARLWERPQVLQPPGRAARRRVQRGRQAREQLQRRARGDLRDRVALQGGRQGGRRPGRQRGRLQRQPRPPRALGERRHAAPPRRRHRRLPLRAVQREPEARADVGAQLRRVLPEPAAGLRRVVRPRRRQLRRRGEQQGQRRRRRPRVAGQRQEQRRPERRRGEGGGGAGGGVVRGERDGRGGEAEGGAGLRVRPRRRGLQGHPARRAVLRAQHHGLPRVVRVQRLLPAEGPLHRHLRLRRRRLRRQPGTKDGQVRAPVHGLNPTSPAKDPRAACIFHASNERMANMAGQVGQCRKEGRLLESGLAFSLSLPASVRGPPAA